MWELIKYKNSNKLTNLNNILCTGRHIKQSTLLWSGFVACWKAKTFSHVRWWLYLHWKLWCISLRNLRIVSVIIFVIDGQKSLMLEKNKFAKLLFVYTFEPVDGVFCIFSTLYIHWTSLNYLFHACIINLLKLPFRVILAGFISRADGYICIYMHTWAKVFRFHIESWPEWDSNPRPCAYRAHALTTELSGRTMRCA